MPNRTIADSVRSSPSLRALTDAGERLWWRIVAAADDFGRFEADPEVLFAACFQRVPKGWTVAKVKKHLQELDQVPADTKNPLIFFYTVEGREYLQIVKPEPHFRKRAEQSKFPAPEKGQLADGHPILRPAPVVKLATSAADLARFENEVWKPYPDRDGKKLYKAKALEFYLDLSPDDKVLIALAVPRYKVFCEKGRLPKDPHRFIKGRDGELWREFIPTTPTPKPVAVKASLVPESKGVPCPPELKDKLKKSGFKFGEAPERESA